MKWVRLENNIVREIIPNTATVPNVEYWYGADFAAMCWEAPDEVGQDWVYDPATETFGAPEPPAPPTPAGLRKRAYETEPIIAWDGDMITVNAAATLWTYYAAEDNDKSAALTELIVAAKAEIRARYPDEDA